jgi:mitochondrial intermembrane space import and assembly protein 40
LQEPAVTIPQSEPIEALESEADKQGAFDPETGEINWDCPCLGGMAHGPCGEEFKSAFSCFVYSNEEPKGMDCIDKFQYVLKALLVWLSILIFCRGMQECFRKYPEIYGAELADDEGDDAGATHDDGDPATQPNSLDSSKSSLPASDLPAGKESTTLNTPATSSSETTKSSSPTIASPSSDIDNADRKSVKRID